MSHNKVYSNQIDMKISLKETSRINSCFSMKYDGMLQWWLLSGYKFDQIEFIRGHFNACIIFKTFGS